ncbi:MAG: NAD(P)H-dependent oxidoreductase [Kouleothrix sp.]|nr:NAD(P)H-dependent oxidoreductase [Kouleothrix sp.]
MKITVLNGSPKGDLSVTMQSVAYLAKLYPQHEFNVLHIAQRLKRLENDRAAFDKVIDQIRESDAVLWGFSLYILIVHAHYKRFIELIFERGAQAAFAGKYTAALSTSIHFFDHTAHNYIHAICDDLEMRFVDSFSQDMHDLLKEEGRQQLAQFGQQLLEVIEQQVPMSRRFSICRPSGRRSTRCSRSRWSRRTSRWLRKHSCPPWQGEIPGKAQGRDLSRPYTGKAKSLEVNHAPKAWFNQALQFSMRHCGGGMQLFPSADALNCKAGASELFLRGKLLPALGTFALFAGIPLGIALVDAIDIPWGWLGAFLLIGLGLVTIVRSVFNRAE